MSFACAYNLFGHKATPDLYCAVPEDRPVPMGLDGSWRFAGRIPNPDMVPGFSAARASDSVRLNGYFLFLARPRRGPRALAA